jgi:hypothetical protein
MCREPRRCGLLLLMIFLAAGVCRASDPPALVAGDVAGLEILREEHYEGKALYGYIDGGAELYREYGFVRMAMQEVSLRGTQYTVEIFRMKDELAALGIYSVSRGDGEGVDSLGSYSCLSNYQVLWASSVYYVRVLNGSGNPGVSIESIDIALALHRKCRGKNPQISPFIRATGASLTGLKYIRGTLGFQNGFDSWTSLFDGMQGYEAFVLPLQSPQSAMTAADVRFRDSTDLHQFLTRVSGRKELKQQWWKIRPNRLIYLEAEGSLEPVAEKLQMAVRQVHEQR